MGLRDSLFRTLTRGLFNSIAGGSSAFSPASLPGAKAFYWMNEGSGTLLRNSIDSTTPDANIWYAPEQVTSKYLTAQGSGITVTGGQSGVNNATSATRVTCTATASLKWAIFNNFTLPAGTYTASCKAKSFDGSAYTFRFADVTHTVLSTDQTVSSSWQTFTYTFTLSTTCTAFSFCAIGSALAASDILFDQIQIVSGSSAQTYNGTGMHARIIPTGTQNWTARGVNVPSATSTLAVALKAAATTVTNFTFYGAFKIASEGNSSFNWLMAHDDIGAATYLKASMCSSGSVAQMYSNSGTTLASRLQKPTDGLWHTLTVQNNDGNGIYKIYLDGVLLETLSAAAGSFTNAAIDLFALPGSVANNTIGEIGALGWYEATHTDAQIRQLSALIKSTVYSRGGATFPTWNDCVLWEGDSLNATPSVSACFPGLIFPNLPANTISPILAKNGSSFTNGAYELGVQLRAPDVIRSLNAIPGKKILNVKCGTNDIALPRTAPQFIGDYRTYFATIQAGVPSVRILFDTIMYRGDRVDLNPVIDTINAQIRADKGTYFYDSPDTAQDPNLNYSAGTASYFQADKVHWSATGQALAATYIQPKVLAALAAP